MIFTHCPFCHNPLEIVQAYHDEFVISDCYDTPQHPKVRFRLHIGERVIVYVHFLHQFNLTICNDGYSYILPVNHLNEKVSFSSSFSDWDWSSAQSILSQIKTILAFS